MILSRTLAKRRIAAGVRPGVLAAWGPVVADALVLAGLFAVVWGPLMRAIDAWQPANALTFALFFIVFFVPLQAVLVVSSIWATRSRWHDKDSSQS